MSDRYYFYKGRVALFAVLKAMGIGNGDEVVLPGFTCVVVPNAITYLGAKPVYADIDPSTYNIDPQKIRAKITGKTRAVIAQHTFGIPADLEAISAIATNHNLYLIEDSCHSIGSEYKGRPVGTFGDAAFFSSQWSKPVTTGLGGWARINNQRLREKMAKTYPEFAAPSLRDDIVLRLQYFLHSALSGPSFFWFARDMYRKLSKYGIAIGSSSVDELEYRMPADYKKRMSGWQREMLERRLKEALPVIGHRKRVVSQYEKLLPGTGSKPVRLPLDYDPVFLRYPVSVRDKERLLAAARGKRIEIGDWFLSPVHPNLEGWEKAGYRKGMCSNAEKACEQVINLPTHSKIGNREIERITLLLEKFGG